MAGSSREFVVVRGEEQQQNGTNFYAQMARSGKSCELNLDFVLFSPNGIPDKLETPPKIDG